MSYLIAKFFADSYVSWHSGGRGRCISDLGKIINATISKRDVVYAYENICVHTRLFLLMKQVRLSRIIRVRVFRRASLTRNVFSRTHGKLMQKKFTALRRVIFEFYVHVCTDNIVQFIYLYLTTSYVLLGIYDYDTFHAHIRCPTIFFRSIEEIDIP